jgi:uncharacterized protein YjdB
MDFRLLPRTIRATKFTQGMRRRWVSAAPAILLLHFGACTPELLFGDPEAVAVAISPGTSTTISVGQELLLSATAQQRTGKTMTGAPISWVSSDPRIATVITASGGARLRGVATGTARVEAAFGGVSASLDVLVRVPVSAVTVSPSSASLVVGQSAQFSAVARDAAGGVLTGRPLVWASSDGGVAAVSATGLVSALSTSGAANRTVTITATSEGRIGSATVVVLR